MRTELLRTLLLLLLVVGVPVAFAADVKISALPAASSVADTDEIPANQAGTTRKITLAQIKAGLGLYSAATSSQYTNSTTTGTEVTALQISLTAGTYRFEYNLLSQSAGTTAAPDFGINYTGTVTRMSARLQYSGTGMTASTGIVDDVITGDAAEAILEQCVVTTETTTAPNLNCITSAAAANVNHQIVIKGTIVVSDSGDLELWAASDAAGTNITVEAGSNVLVWKF